jgi:hypothetical protein
MARKYSKLLCLIILLTLGVTAIPLVLEARQCAHFIPQKACFAVKFKNEISPYSVIGVFVTPEEILPLEVPENKRQDSYFLQALAGKVLATGINRWHWQAPKEPGLYPVIITRHPCMDFITLNVFVMVPSDRLKGQCLNGYRIGAYPACSLERSSIYSPPKGFVEVTKKNEEALLSPHFKLKQFLCKQEGGYPKYVVLSERLILKLELLLEMTNQEGYRCETFDIMSGYRTPYYNRCIGNVRYSCHLWGYAADIDGMKDDLNREFKIDYRDAARLTKLVEKLHNETAYRPFLGGLARYKGTSAHGPFVHVDVRGFQAGWGRQ